MKRKANGRLLLNEKTAEAAVWGGAVLGGGGGGSMQDGITLAQLAVRMGDLELVPVDEIPSDSLLLTVAAVGAPAAKERYVRPAHYVRAVELFQKCFDIRPDGVIANECGGNATVNGWLQASVLGIALVDAPCNGRAHPTGIMGSMGLHKKANFVSRQTAVGGNPAAGRYLEFSVSGSLEAAALAVRKMSVEAGGLVAVARNPVTAEYAKCNAAPGAIAKCIELGRVMLMAREKKQSMAVEAAAEYLQGEIIAEGLVKSVQLETKGGFDVGVAVVESSKGVLELSFWNEYMTAEIDGQRLGTFPDLIATIDACTGEPVVTAQMQPGRKVAVLYVPRDKLILSAGMRDPELFRLAEQAVGKPIIPYVFNPK